MMTRMQAHTDRGPKIPNKQLHCELESGIYAKFQLAVNQLGYPSMSQYLRRKVLQAIKKAEILNASEPSSHAKKKAESEKSYNQSPLKNFQSNFCQSCDAHCAPSETRFICCLLAALLDEGVPTQNRTLKRDYE